MISFDKEKNWISVKDKLPKDNELVLVIGFISNELSGKINEKSVGLVNWYCIEQSYCQDYCYYWVKYVDITHWMPIKLHEHLI